MPAANAEAHALQTTVGVPGGVWGVSATPPPNAPGDTASAVTRAITRGGRAEAARVVVRSAAAAAEALPVSPAAAAAASDDDSARAGVRTGALGGVAGAPTPAGTTGGAAAGVASGGRGAGGWCLGGVAVDEAALPHPH